MDERETDLIADGVIAPDFVRDDVVVVAQPARHFDHRRGHIQMKCRAEFREVGPLREGLEVIDRFAGFDLDDALKAVAFFERPEHEVGIDRAWAGADRDVLFRSGVDAGVIFSAQLELEQPNQAIVLQLFTYRPHQDGAQLQRLQTIGSDEIIKLASLARICVIPPYPIAFVPDSVRGFHGPGVQYQNVSTVETTAPVSTILIVDDDEGVTQTFARMLTLEGYQVRTAFNAESGLRAATEIRPNAIILDLRMPLVDGLGFLRQLRSMADQQDSPTPVAIVTGDYFLDDSVAAELRQLGAELRFKPLWLEDLVGLARNLLKVTH